MVIMIIPYQCSLTDIGSALGMTPNNNAGTWITKKVSEEAIIMRALNGVFFVTLAQWLQSNSLLLGISGLVIFLPFFFVLLIPALLVTGS